MKKSLIEEASIELLELFEKVSEEARKEKNAIPPINKMHYWWTRKPLIVGRAIALTSTLENIDDVKLFLGLNSSKRAYQYIPDKEKYQEKLGVNPKKIKVLDPFGGAGNLVFPAAQLGLNITCADYNPVAYIIQKSILEIPAKYGEGIAEKFEKISNQIAKEAKKELERFYKPRHLAYLWLWCITCPFCTQRIPLTNKMFIVKTSKKKIGVKFTPTENKNFTIEIIKNMVESEGGKYTQKGGKVTCISCRNPIDYKTMVKDISKNKDREMIAIQIQKSNGRDYVLPTKEDKKLYDECEKYFQSKKSEFEKDNLIPKENILHDPRSPLKNYGILYWDEFFSARQLLTLIVFLKKIQRACNDEKNPSLNIYLGIFLSNIMTGNSLGILWDYTIETTGHVLQFRRPSFVFNHVEINPFEKIRGGCFNIIPNISKAIKFATSLKNPSDCFLRSVTNPIKSKYDLIITDPPYGDDVQYGELSEFFYVWLYRCLKEYFPELPVRVQLDEDFCESWGRFGDKKLATEFFTKGLKKSFVSLGDKLKDDGLLVVFFAHSSTEAWDTLLKSIREGKFRIVNSFPVHTENPNNPIARGKSSFTSSIIVVCFSFFIDSVIF